MDPLSLSKNQMFQSLHRILLENTQPHSVSKDQVLPLLESCFEKIFQLFNYPKQDTTTRVAPNTTNITINAKQYTITEPFRKAMAILSNEIDMEENLIAEKMIDYAEECFSEGELAEKVMVDLCFERKSILDCLLLILDSDQAFKNNPQLIAPLKKYGDKLFNHKDPLSKKSFAQSLLESLDKSITKSCHLDQSSSSSFLHLVSRNVVVQWHRQLSDECFQFAQILMISGRWYRKDQDFMIQFVNVIKQVDYKHPAFNFLLLSFMFTINPTFLNDQPTSNYDKLKEQFPAIEKLYSLLTDQDEWKVKEAKNLLLIYLILVIAPCLTTLPAPSSPMKIDDLRVHIETSIKNSALSLWKRVLSKVRGQYLIQNECSSSLTHIISSNIHYNEFDQSVYNKFRSYPLSMIEQTERISNHLIVNLITQFGSQLRRIKNFEDDISASMNRNPELKNANSTTSIPDFMDCVTLTYSNSQHLSTTQFFFHGDLRLNHFLTWSSDNGQTLGNYFNMLSSFIKDGESAELVLKFLWASDDRLFASAVPMYHNLSQHCLTKLDEMVARMDQFIDTVLKTPNESQMAKEIGWVQSFVNLIFCLILHDSNIHLIFSKVNIDFIPKLLNLICAPVPTHLKATALDCLRGFARQNAESKLEDVKRIWSLIETYQIIPSRPPTSKLSFPLADELLHNEKALKNYSETIALIRLFSSLLYPVIQDPFKQPHFPTSIPQDLNNDYGALPYIQFIINLVVQPIQLRQFSHPIDEWLIKYEGLKFIDVCLDTLDVRIIDQILAQPISFSHQPIPQSIAEWNKLIFNPGFYILLRFLGDDRLSTIFLDGFKEASVLLGNGENLLIHNHLIFNLKIFQTLLRLQPVITREILPKLYHMPLNSIIKPLTERNNTILDLLNVRQEGLGPLAVCFQFEPSATMMEMSSKTLLQLLNHPQLPASKGSKDRLLTLFDKCQTHSLIQNGVARRLEDCTIYLDNNFFPLNAQSDRINIIHQFVNDLENVLTFIGQSVDETRNFPNLAFNVLGYQTSFISLLPYGAHGNYEPPTIKTDIQSGLLNILQALSFNIPKQLDQITPSAASSPSSFVHFKFPQLTEKMFKILVKLSQHNFCREPTLRFLRHYDEFYCEQLILAANHHYNPSDEGTLTLPNRSVIHASYDDVLSQMKYRASLLQLTAIELHQSAMLGFRIPSNNIVLLLLNLYPTRNVSFLLILQLLESLLVDWTPNLTEDLQTFELSKSVFNGIDLQKFIQFNADDIETYDLESLTDHLVCHKTHFLETLHLSNDTFDFELDLLIRFLSILNSHKTFEYFKFKALNHWKQLVAIILLEWVDKDSNNELKSLMTQVLNYIESKLQFSNNLTDEMKKELMEVIWWGNHGVSKD